jgi:hypothetical protein
MNAVTLCLRKISKKFSACLHVSTSENCYFFMIGDIKRNIHHDVLDVALDCVFEGSMAVKNQKVNVRVQVKGAIGHRPNDSRVHLL